MTVRSFIPTASLTLGLVAWAASSRADVFSWNNITYAPTPTVATQQTSLGAGGGTNSVSIQFALNSGATFLTNVQSPTVSNYNANNTYYASGGATNPAENFLQIAADLVSSTGGIGSITVNLFFAKPVTSLSFSFFDVDINAAANNTSGAYADQITNIYGTTTSNAKVYLGTNSNTLTPGTANGLTGTAGTATYGVLASANNVNNLAAANAAVSFTSATPFTELTYTYGDGYVGSGTHGAAQITALSDLNFTTVPEPGTLAMLSLGAFGAGLIAFRQRRA